MSHIKFGRFARYMVRSAEMAATVGMSSAVTNTYTGVLRVPAEAYLAAHAAVTSAETVFAKKDTVARTALEKIDQPYRVARTTAMAFMPELRLPEVLSQQTTDTDQSTAVRALIEAVKSQAGQPWADDLMAGIFGQLAPASITAIAEATAANLALAQATTLRQKAYAVAHPPYIAFKKVVREALGAHSKEYRRIHAPTKRGAAEEEETDTTDTTEKNGAGTTPTAEGKPTVSAPDGTGKSPTSTPSPTTTPATPPPPTTTPATPAPAGSATTPATPATPQAA
jgi:hypothetical protein